MLEEVDSFVNEMKYLGAQICHRCLPCKTVDLLLVNAPVLTETFAHTETSPRVAIFLIKIKAIKYFLFVLGTLPNSFLTVGHGLPGALVHGMI